MHKLTGFQTQYFLMIQLLFWLKGFSFFFSSPNFKMCFAVFKAFGAQAQFSVKGSYEVKGHLRVPTKLGTCVVVLYWDSSPPWHPWGCRSLLWGHSDLAGDDWPTGSPLSQHTAEGSAWSFSWGDIQMNAASSILHCYISSNSFDSCFAR